MPKRLVLLSFLIGFSLLLPQRAAPQRHPDDEYYPYAERERPRPRLESDTTLFYRAIQSPTDLYGAHTDFTLPGVARRRRGADYAQERTLLSGIGISYRYLTTLRLLGADEQRSAGLQPAADPLSGTVSTTQYDFPDALPLQPYRVSATLTDRNYRYGVRLAGSRTFGRKWYLTAAADLRTGRDMHVEGVFTHAATVGFHLSHRTEHRGEFSLTGILPLSMRGTRLSSSEEAFTLTGNRLYNPAWGYQDGRVRNSRVRRETLPLVAAAWRGRLTASTTLTASLATEAGRSRYSSLGWYDARTPMPDNYRYLPGYADDRATREAWLANDPRYTQIDWDELIRQNRMAADGAAVYALEDRVERLWTTTLHALFATDLDHRLTLRYGVDLSFDDRRNYKQMRDLLGADHIVDIDQFLIDDDTYGTQLQNDLRHPDRIIRTGDRFGYDYTLATRRLLVFLQADYRTDRFRGDLSLLFGSSAVNRRGHYEKELFPGSQSRGRSRVLRFAPYRLKATGGWAFTPRHYVELSLLAEARTPSAGDLFYQPLYNNLTLDNPSAEHTWAVEAVYRLTGPVLTLEAALFSVLTLDGVETRRYYDDLSYRYCDMAVTGLGTWSLGIETAADIRLSERWRLLLAASAGRYRYVRNPTVTVLSDVDNAPVDIGSESRMGGCRVGGAPQLTASAELAWFGPRGWGIRASSGYAGSRYVEPAVLRRTDRVAGQTGVTPEAFAAFTRQERLADAFTLDASLFKSFWFDRSRLTVSLLLRNLTGQSSTAYNGYESLRVRRIRSGDETFYTPHATRYSYLLPRSFYLTISYRF